MKTVLISLNTPTNLLIAYLIFYFFKMGVRFLSYIDAGEEESKSEMASESELESVEEMGGAC